jgi:hypothetical protein
MSESQPSFPTLAAKTAVCHTLTYFLMGTLAAYFLNYGAEFAKPGSGMRPISDPWVIAGPLFQPLRGVIFASVFYPLRDTLFGKKNGWFVMAWLLIAVGILSTFGPAPASIEGMIYTPVPPLHQLRSWLELVPQAVLLSLLLFYWVRNPAKWLNWLLGTIFVIAMALPVLGLLARQH